MSTSKKLKLPTTSGNREIKTTDKVVLRVIEKLHSCSAVGLLKYGVGLERKDLNLLQWLNHAQQEALDFANYLEKLIEIETSRDQSAAPTNKTITLKSVRLVKNNPKGFKIDRKEFFLP